MSIRNGRKSLVLLSGGIDSAVAARYAVARSSRVVFLTFEYQQLNSRELRCAREIAKHLHKRGSRHEVYPLDFTLVARCQRTALLDRRRAKKGREFNFYVPGRNLIFLAHAAAVAESYDLDDLYIGSNFQDSPVGKKFGYPDSGSAFLALMQQVINQGLKFRKDLRIEAPLLWMNKYEVIRQGMDHGIDFRMTWSCYLNGPRACGECPACLTRIINFHWAGFEDPIPYQLPYCEVLERALASYLPPGS